MIKREIEIKKVFKTEEDFSKYVYEDYQQNGFTRRDAVDYKNLEFDCDIKIPFSFSLKGIGNVNAIQNFLSQNKYSIRNCNFNGRVEIKESHRELKFESCNFNLCAKIESRSSNLTFKDCSFKRINLEETKFNKSSNGFAKLRVKRSDVYFSNFKNARFNDLVDFYKTTFHENLIFYKTDFLDILVLSATKFKKNLLFTYTLLGDKVILRSTVFEAGFDFSLSIIKGQLAIFDLEHTFDSFKTIGAPKDEEDYEIAVSIDGNIPISNKLETYRLLKAEFETQKNIPESLKFKLIEKRTYKRILETQDLSWQNVFDQISLWLNWKSNKHGTSYWSAFRFIILVGGFFFYLSLIATSSFEPTWNPLEWDYENGISYFMQFLIPTHKFNYLGEGVNLNWGYYTLDFLGRLFVGYGIYQFIQAFRKFK